MEYVFKGRKTFSSCHMIHYCYQDRRALPGMPEIAFTFTLYLLSEYLEVLLESPDALYTGYDLSRLQMRRLIYCVI